MPVSWLKKGKAAQAALKQEEAKADAMKKDGPRRFYIPKGKEGVGITFLDGNLDADGVLDVPMLYEHNLNINNSWLNWFPCTANEEPCPICEQGDKPSLVAAFSVIDHSEWEDKKGVAHKDEVRLLIAKRGTLKVLQKLAKTRGGLAGPTWQVSRTENDKSPSVGDIFEFMEKKPVAALLKLYKGAALINYEKAFGYKTAQELRDLGFGKEGGGMGGSHGDDGEGVPQKAVNKVSKPKVKQPTTGDEDEADATEEAGEETSSDDDVPL